MSYLLPTHSLTPVLPPNHLITTNECLNNYSPIPGIVTVWSVCDFNKLKANVNSVSGFIPFRESVVDNCIDTHTHTHTQPMHTFT